MFSKWPIQDVTKTSKSQGSVEIIRWAKGLNVVEFEKLVDGGFGIHIATNF